MPERRLRPPASARTPVGRGRSLGPPPAAAAAFPIVAIGASAGGLDACQRLFDGVAASTGMAFIVVQHLDPTHGSLLATLLAGHTGMTVKDAVDGERLAPDHVYVIPPGSYLAVRDGILGVTVPTVRRGARLPFDFLLAALAADCGPRTICVVLSGTGGDGSLGLKAVKAAGGAVIAQDPDEAAYDGMPRSAILTGGVDRVLTIQAMPDVIGQFGRSAALRRPGPSDADSLSEIVALVRSGTDHDFSLYKPGTLQRRIQRRMALLSIPAGQMERYARTLRGDPAGVEILAKDLLIHVTSFFRDPKVFDALAETIAPEFVRGRTPDNPIRVWIAGCSTGEEAYSVAIVLKEAIAAANVDARLQVFASDVDAEAVAAAREGHYPETIANDVSPARLAKFFTRDDNGYRVTPELRGCVVFTVQNLLADPPFSRLDLISCRNLLIYLRPEAQAKAIAILHFALNDDGVLLLGGSEGVGRADDRFQVISKPARLYRRIGRARHGDFTFPTGAAAAVRPAPRPGQTGAAARQASLADLCRRMVLEAHSPAAVLTNRARECLYTLGPTDQYLRVAAGSPSLDLLAMARPGVRAKLSSAILLGFEKDDTVVVTGGRIRRDGKSHAFHVEARPVKSGGDDLLLLCFLDASSAAAAATRPGGAPESLSRVSELEAELEAAKVELHTALRSLEIANEEQTTINEEALSVNEEYQSTNEELLTSKEELQSLNEELNALNGQLQESLDLQRTSATDLQNILYSTDVATVFLDMELHIRFFTPATKVLFNVIPGDVGRPLSDLKSLAIDEALLTDARDMLVSHAPVVREIRSEPGAWFLRRIMPYRAEGDAVEGVVITYSDITERKRIAESLEAAIQAADSANRAKSRFLAAASHDLRQPLQTLTLIQGLLARRLLGPSEQKLIGVQEQCLNAMSGMLNTLLDINQIDAGVVQPQTVDFPIDRLFDALRDEFTYHAQAKRLSLRIVPCRLSVNSDPTLLEQMIRNLIANAVKYTTRGKILVGCRRRGAHLRIEVVDTGIGMHAAELRAIFEEYHQVDNAARERSRGLGLGLSIVKRLGDLLGHEVGVRSRIGRGSSFSIDVPLAAGDAGRGPARRPEGGRAHLPSAAPVIGQILVVEDDPEVRELLELALREEGHVVTAAADSFAALDLVQEHGLRPDVILVDFNLPDGMTGLELAARLRRRLRADCPVVVLTGDITTETLREIAGRHCVPLHKPVKHAALMQVIQGLLARPAAPAAGPLSRPDPADAPVVFVVDDDSAIRDVLSLALEAEGLAAVTYPDCEAFLADYRLGRGGCLLLDAYLHGGMDGLDLLAHLREAGDKLPVIMITGEADVAIAVRAMKAGAADFIEKPITAPALIAAIRLALEQSQDSGKLALARTEAAARIDTLTRRQHQILDLVLAGEPSKNIAADLGISQRTVENHRAAIMSKTGARSLPALARLAIVGDASR